MKTTRTNESAICKSCLTVLDAATSDENAVPSEGDITVCFYCTTVSKFDSELMLEPLNEFEQKQIQDDDPAMWGKIQHTIRQIKLFNDYKKKQN